jgi:hypothetical protein
MAPRPEALRPVEAFGNVRLDMPGGRTLELVAAGECLTMEVAGWQDVRELMPRSFRSRRRSLALLATLVSAHGLTFSIESSGKPVFQIGHNVVPGLLSRLLGLAPAYVPLAAFGLLLRR